MRAACAYLAEPDLRGDALLAGLASAAGVFYNFSGQVSGVAYYCWDIHLIIYVQTLSLLRNFAHGVRASRVCLP